MDRQLRWYDYLTINIYWFALTTRSQVLSPLIVPVLVQRFAGDAVKGTYVGRMRLWALMAAVLMQAAMGMLSDRSTSRWGRRRPFIVIGTLGELVILALIGAATVLEGMTGYWVLFGLYILSMIASNTAHAATQGLIPDLVPEDQRGRFSGVKALLELPVPLIFSSFVVAKMVEAGDIWGALIALMVVMVVCAAITMFAPERRLSKRPTDSAAQLLLRLTLMTAAFTVIILGAGAAVSAVMRGIVHLSAGLSSVLIVVAGVVGMAAAILAGVWICVSISLGRHVRQHHSFVWWVVTRLAFLAAATNLATFMIYYLQERFPALAGAKAAGPAAQIMMFVGIFIMVTAVPSGWLADRFGKRLLVGLSGAIAAVGISVILLIPVMPAMYAGGSLIGAAMGLFYSANWALGTEIVPQDEAGRYLGLSNIAGAGAGAIGAYVGGPIGDQYGYVVLFVIYGAMFLLSILALTGVRERVAHA
jgi:MFS family permease